MRTKLGRVLLAVALIAAVVSTGVGPAADPVSAEPSEFARLVDFGDPVGQPLFSPSGDLAYVPVAGAESSEIHVMETTTWTRVARIPLGEGRVGGTDLTDDGATILAGLSGAGEVLEISTATRAIVSRVDVSDALALVPERPGEIVGDVRALGGTVVVSGQWRVVAYDRVDPAGTMRRVGGDATISGAGRIFASEGLATLSISSGSSPNKLYIFDATDPEYPLVAVTPHINGIEGVKGAALDWRRDRVITGEGDVVALADASFVGGGPEGSLLTSADGTVMWSYTVDRIQVIDAATLVVIDEYQPSCPSIMQDASRFVSLVADPAEEHLVISTGSRAVCVEPLDGEDPPPTAPRNVTAEPLESGARVAWQEANSVHRVLPDEYVATATPGGRRCVTAALSCEISGLTNGVEYTVSVAGRTDGVVGPASVATTVTPALPAPPESPSAVPGTGQATISWVVPTGDDVVAADRFVVVSSPGGITCESAATSCVVTGLANGTSYTFTVRGVVGGVEGPASPATGPVVPNGAAAAQDVVASGGDSGHVWISWTPPEPGEAPLPDTFRVTAHPGGATCVSSRSSCSISTLAPAVEYTFTVASWRDGVMGAVSLPSPPFVYGLPLAPVDVVAAPGDLSSRVEWVPVPGFARADAHTFVVTASPGSRSCETAANYCVVHGLENGVSYTFTVVGYVNGFAGQASEPSNSVTPGPAHRLPPPPGSLTITPEGEVSWSLGSGGPVDDLTVRYRETQAPAGWLDPLIIGGDPLAIDNHRYGVKLFGFDGSTLAGECGGVLIDPQWVLTAAHCTEYQPTGSWYTSIDYFSIIPGLADWTDFQGDLDRHRIFSEQIIVHPDFDRDTLENDLALVRLETPVAPDVGDTIPLYPFASLEDGAQAFVSGWGADERGVLPDVVRGVEVSVDADCGSWPAITQGFDPAKTMCTTAIGEGACSGDSGGPVVVNQSGSLFLAGVVSFGSSAGCGVDPSLPDGHVRVAAYVDWIESNVGPLWSELSLPPSATSAQLDDLGPGRTYVITVEARNDIGSAFAVRTMTTPGMRVLGPDALTVDCLTPIGHPFADVPSTSFASGSIGCIYALGITTGTSATAYSPKDFVTRGQMAAFVARFIESVTGESCTGSHPFTDVAPGSFMNGPVGCIADLGITNGTSPTTYAPNSFVTREQMAAFVARLYRAVTGETCSLPTGFGDVPSTSFAFRDVGCIGSIGVTQGTSPTTYSPKDFVTREQMAAFVERLFKTVTA